MIKRFFKRLFCKHLYTTRDPIEAPEIWGWVYECGICGHRKDVTDKVLFGKIQFTPPDAFDELIARKRALGTIEQPSHEVAGAE